MDLGRRRRDPLPLRLHPQQPQGNSPIKKNLAPLTGETLLASEIGNPGTSTVSGTCNPLGTSTFTFTVTGGASGPYPGTFTETGR